MEKIIKNYENYSITEKSIITNIKTGKILKHTVDKYGYLQVSLTSNGISKTKRVHKLMAETFLNHISCGMKEVINHINNNKLDNNINNLEIVTPRYNTTCHKKNGGYNLIKSSNKWRAQIFYLDRNYHLGCYLTEVEAKEAYLKGLNIILSNQLNTIELLKLSYK